MFSWARASFLLASIVANLSNRLFSILERPAIAICSNFLNQEYCLLFSNLKIKQKQFFSRPWQLDNFEIEMVLLVSNCDLVVESKIMVEAFEFFFKFKKKITKVNDF